MKYIHLFTSFLLLSFLIACSPNSMDEESYNNWRHSLGDPEMSDMKYGGNTTITKEKKIAQVDLSLLRVGKAQGDYMEVITRQFRQDLVSTGSQVRHDGSKVYVQIPVQSIFGSNQATIKPSAEPVLKAVAQNLKAHPETMIRVIGHTDNSQSVQQSKALSLRQANAFSDYLRLSGVDAGRLLAEGHGSADPISNNNTPAGRAKNCYIEMIVYNLQ